MAIPLRRRCRCAGQAEQEVRKLRIGYFEDDGRTPVTPETRAAVRTAAEALRSAGFQVEPFQPEGLEAARQLWWQFFGVAGGMLLGPMFKGRESDLSPILKQFLEWSRPSRRTPARPCSTPGFSAICCARSSSRRCDEYPILLCPAAAIPAFRHGERSWQDRRQDRRLSRCLELHRMVQPAGQSRCGGSGRPFAGRIAHRRADRRPALGRGAGLDGRRCTGKDNAAAWKVRRLAR